MIAENDFCVYFNLTLFSDGTQKHIHCQCLSISKVAGE